MLPPLSLVTHLYSLPVNILEAPFASSPTSHQKAVAYKQAPGIIPMGSFVLIWSSSVGVVTWRGMPWRSCQIMRNTTYSWILWTLCGSFLAGNNEWTVIPRMHLSSPLPLFFLIQFPQALQAHTGGTQQHFREALTWKWKTNAGWRGGSLDWLLEILPLGWQIFEHERWSQALLKWTYPFLSDLGR